MPKPVLPPPRLTRVRCLGPRLPEHSFESPDPVGERVCQACRRTQDGMRVALRYLCGTPTSEGGRPIPDS